MDTPVKHYTARLELPTNHTVIDLAGDDLGDVKENVQRIMGGGCIFQNYGNIGLGTLIFHPSVGEGKKAMGWLATIEVPPYLSTKGWMERRERVAA